MFLKNTSYSPKVRSNHYISNLIRVAGNWNWVGTSLQAGWFIVMGTRLHWSIFKVSSLQSKSCFGNYFIINIFHISTLKTLCRLACFANVYYCLVSHFGNWMAFVHAERVYAHRFRGPWNQGQCAQCMLFDRESLIERLVYCCILVFMS